MTNYTFNKLKKLFIELYEECFEEEPRYVNPHTLMQDIQKLETFLENRREYINYYMGIANNTNDDMDFFSIPIEAEDHWNIRITMEDM